MRNILTCLFGLAILPVKAQVVDTITIIRIPVIFHIIYTDHSHAGGTDGGNISENLSDSLLMAELADLHRDFLLLNSDTNKILADFKPIISNPHIEFYLADTQFDPAGTKGIVRVHLRHVGRELWKYSPVIDHEKYLNVYTGDIGGSFNLSQFPWQDPKTDAVYLSFDWIGQGYRLLTHETGHWLGLLHLWGAGGAAGDGNSCTTGDNITDTPPQAEATQTNTLCDDCPKPIGNGTHDARDKSCVPGQPSNYNNYMDYSGCRRMFTQQQVIAMRGNLKNNRSALWPAP